MIVIKVLWLAYFVFAANLSPAAVVRDLLGSIFEFRNHVHYLKHLFLPTCPVSLDCRLVSSDFL